MVYSYLYPILKWRGVHFVQYGSTTAEGDQVNWLGLNWGGLTVLGFLWEFLLFNVTCETTLYWTHRLFHSRLLYKRFHKLHHNYVTPIALASEYAHPVEILWIEFLPVVWGIIIFGGHVASLWLWAAFRVSESTISHSGYCFPIDPCSLIPFHGGTQMHDYHHSHNLGCYGVYIYWDWLMGTDKHYSLFLNQAGENEQEIKKRIKNH